MLALSLVEGMFLRIEFHIDSRMDNLRIVFNGLRLGQFTNCPNPASAVSSMVDSVKYDITYILILAQMYLALPNLIPHYQYN